MLHTILITVHAVAATVAVAAGILSASSGRFLGIYRAGMATMALALAPAIIADWSTTDPTARIVFTSLLGLAVVMVVRSELAARQSPARTGGPTAGYLEHVGFTLIALADGFAVVAAIRSGVPGWAVGVLAVGVVVIGHLSLQLAKRRLVHPGAAAPVVSA